MFHLRIVDFDRIRQSRFEIDHVMLRHPLLSEPLATKWNQLVAGKHDKYAFWRVELLIPFPIKTWTIPRAKFPNHQHSPWYSVFRRILNTIHIVGTVPNPCYPVTNTQFTT